MQPPPARPAIGMIARRRIVEHEHRDHRTRLRGGMERGLIGKPQVAAEPDDLNLFHPHHRSC